MATRVNTVQLKGKGLEAPVWLVIIENSRTFRSESSVLYKVFQGTLAHRDDTVLQGHFNHE